MTYPMPLHPELTFAESRGTSEAGFRDTAQLEAWISVRYPNGEESGDWALLGSPLKARMRTAGFRVSEIAAARGIKAQWELVFELGADVHVGERALVRGSTNGVAWQRLVVITADLGLTGRVHRQTTAVDVELDQ